MLRNFVWLINRPSKTEPINRWVVFFFFIVGPNVSRPHWQQRNRRRLSIITLPTRPCLRNDNWNHGTSLLTHLGISNYKIISLSTFFLFFLHLGLIASRFLIIIIQRILLNTENAQTTSPSPHSISHRRRSCSCVCVILKTWSKNKISIYPPPPFLFSVN